MTREALLQRLMALKIGAAQLTDGIAEVRADLKVRLANLDATKGAIQECEYWIGRLAEAEVTTLADRRSG